MKILPALREAAHHPCLSNAESSSSLAQNQHQEWFCHCSDLLDSVQKRVKQQKQHFLETDLYVIKRLHPNTLLEVVADTGRPHENK